MFWGTFFRVPATGRGFPYIQHQSQQLQYEGFLETHQIEIDMVVGICQFMNYFPKIPPTANVQILGIGSPLHFCASFHQKKGWTVNLRESLPVGQMAIFSTFDRCIARKLRFLSFSEGKDFRILICCFFLEPKCSMYGIFTLQGTNISHRRKIIFKSALLWDSSLEGTRIYHKLKPSVGQ